MRRRRLDGEIVRRNLASTAAEAAALVASGRVTVGGAPASNPGRYVGPDEAVVVIAEPPRFVTRAGAKLAAALDHFNLSVDGARALDAGASGGGFTDCLIQRGVRHVVAVDVGYGQIHERLRADRRVEVRDRTNIRDLAPGDLGPPFDLVVADLSFISLRLVAPQLVGQGRDGSDMVLLVKPQFEATRAETSDGRGVIRDTDVHQRVVTEVGAAVEHVGASVQNVVTSPVQGTHGNTEFLMHAVIGSDSLGAHDLVPRQATFARFTSAQSVRLWALRFRQAM